MKFLTLFALLMTTQAFAQDSAQDIEREITEGKIQAAETDALKTAQKNVDQKFQQVSRLLSKVIEIAYQRGSVGSDEFREDAEYAHSGFVARVLDIKADQEALARKQILPDLASLQKDESRLDKLITDIQAFLK
jgi:predicted phage gp36 major capsid-like protein